MIDCKMTQIDTRIWGKRSQDRISGDLKCDLAQDQIFDQEIESFINAFNLLIKFLAQEQKSLIMI
jgi:hypothetical protein